jgi:hypothetical protein
VGEPKLGTSIVKSGIDKFGEGVDVLVDVDDVEGWEDVVFEA